jgi:hypothetical protein
MGKDSTNSKIKIDRETWEHEESYSPGWNFVASLEVTLMNLGITRMWDWIDSSDTERFSEQYGSKDIEYIYDHSRQAFVSIRQYRKSIESSLSNS